MHLNCSKRSANDLIFMLKKIHDGTFVRQAGPEHTMSTVLETIEGGTRYLEQRGVEDARRNMQMLVAKQLDCSRMELYMQFDRPLKEEELAPLRKALKRRGDGIPLQHVLGSVHFFQHEFLTDSRALIPRPETEELVEWILSWEMLDHGRILDMGCGSGVIGLSLAAQRPHWQLTLADLSEQALSLAKENSQRLAISNITWLESDLFSNVSGEFDGIVANLPYVPEADRALLTREVMHDPSMALFSGNDGMDLLRRFIPEASERLRSGGWLVLEIGIGQAAEVGQLMQSAGLELIEIRRDLSGVDRFPLAKKP
ncbi:MAG: peptide chain release factor N(5)-glutamine methyltransferase [Verrucomicrobia bacterium]|nr:MAG: peptide chain release factor N(5)-glutamine methyltransferase [Verrucomicrobiota bacterium]